jgi:hypothetical protein
VARDIWQIGCLYFSSFACVAEVPFPHFALTTLTSDEGIALLLAVIQYIYSNT